MPKVDSLMPGRRSEWRFPLCEKIPCSLVIGIPSRNQTTSALGEAWTVQMTSVSSYSLVWMNVCSCSTTGASEKKVCWCLVSYPQKCTIVWENASFSDEASENRHYVNRYGSVFGKACYVHISCLSRKQWGPIDVRLTDWSEENLAVFTNTLTKSVFFTP